ncbi:MAG TPA: hypothetical protein VFV83_02990, partial [Chthoniobacteraceae bacterium]|nr:hypothetical protein [Chthoniobacteraceae bacterium]
IGLFNPFSPRFIYRVEANGQKTVIAGNGRQDPRTIIVDTRYFGDGGLAKDADITEVLGMTFGPDGCLYITDNYAHRIRKIRTDGTIVTFAGSGLPDATGRIPSGYSGDGGPATAAQLFGPEGIIFGPDGSLYIADTGNHRIRRVRVDGVIEPIAGQGGSGQFGGGFSGDGGPALAAMLDTPRGLGFGSDGSLYIADFDNYRVRRIAPDGIISTIAGSGTTDLTIRDGGPATASFLDTPRGIAVAPDGSFLVTEYQFSANRVRRIAAALPGVQNGQALIPSSDASEAYVFDAKGRHLQTLDTVTGVVKFQFSYDGAGQLQSVADRNGNVTTIERGANGAPTAIIAPGGQRTALALEANGFLASVANPAQDIVRFTYNADGLMQTLIDPKGQTHSFTYDANGRLIRDEDPAGGFTTLARTETPRGFNISMATAGGGVVTFETERLPTGDLRLATVDEHGGRTEVIQQTDGHQTGTFPDGSTVVLRRQPEARFGAQALTLQSVTTTTPAGMVSTASSTQTVTLANPADPLSVQTFTTTLTLNGKTTTTAYDAASRTITATTPAGCQSITTFDARGRVTSLLPDPAMDPLTFTYDAMGRTVKQQQGAQSWSYAYDVKNRVISRTDALNQQTQYAYDDADRLTQLISAGNHVFEIGYDANGNRTEITMPSGAKHSFSYNPIDLRTGYTAPGNSALTRLYNLEGAITQTTLPGGAVTEQLYDEEERLAALNTPEASIGFAYGDLTERATAITRTPVGGATAQEIALTYDAGELPASLTWTGPAQGGYTFTYDADTLLSHLQFSSGADTANISLVRDVDGLVNTYGPFTITRAGPGGETSQIADEKLASTFTYDGAARLLSRMDVVNGVQVYKIALSYDAAGRIAQRIETTGGADSTFLYEYDSDFQLT